MPEYMPENEEERDIIAEAIEGLRSSDIKKRLTAVDRLAVLGNHQAIYLLEKALYEESWHLRLYAAKGLAKIGKKAIPSLLKTLSDGLWYTRASAAYALGEIGDERIAEPLFELAGDRNETVKNEAMVALAKIASRYPVVFVRNCLLEKDREGQLTFLRALREIAPDGHRELVTLLAEETSEPLSHFEFVSREWPKPRVPKKPKDEADRDLDQSD